MEMAKRFSTLVRTSQDFILVAPVDFSLVCFRHQAGDAFNEKLLNTLNQNGKLYLSHTKLDDSYTLRLSIGAAQTQVHHIETAWQVILETAQRLEH
jgi:aromatic-L-amino-acid decarboxylase